MGRVLCSFASSNENFTLKLELKIIAQPKKKKKKTIETKTPREGKLDAKAFLLALGKGPTFLESDSQRDSNPRPFSERRTL